MRKIRDYIEAVAIVAISSVLMAFPFIGIFENCLNVSTIVAFAYSLLVVVLLYVMCFSIEGIKTRFEGWF